MEGDRTPSADTIGTGNFNPLPPYGGRLYILDECKLTERISIHSLRMEGDSYKDFRGKYYNISIHSLRMEGDQMQL